MGRFVIHRATRVRLGARVAGLASFASTGISISTRISTDENDVAIGLARLRCALKGADLFQLSDGARDSAFAAPGRSRDLRARLAPARDHTQNPELRVSDTGIRSSTGIIGPRKGGGGV